MTPSPSAFGSPLHLPAPPIRGTGYHSTTSRAIRSGLPVPRSSYPIRPYHIFRPQGHSLPSRIPAIPGMSSALLLLISTFHSLVSFHLPGNAPPPVALTAAASRPPRLLPGSLPAILLRSPEPLSSHRASSAIFHKIRPASPNFSLSFARLHRPITRPIPVHRNVARFVMLRQVP